MAINGNNIYVTQNGTIIAGTKSNEIQTESEMIEISNPSSGDWRQYMAGRKNWSIQVSFLVTAVANIRQLLNVGTQYTLVFRDRAGSTSVTGTALLKTCKITSTKGSLVQGSFAFQGTGQLS